MPFFSILIPVYNVEDYLEQCLESVINQTFSDYEVVLLNDGSTDNSVEICKKYVNMDSRFRLIHQENQGLLKTRRRLYKEMKGQYAVCLDGDDYKPVDSLQICYDLITKYKCDMLIGRLCEVSNEGVFWGESKLFYDDEKLFVGEEKKELYNCFCATGLLNSLVIKIVRKEIIDLSTDYSEYVDVKGEDMLQSIALLKNANSILYTTHIMYYYRSSLNSRSNNFKLKYIHDLNVVYGRVLEFCIEYCDPKALGELIHFYLHKQRYMLGLALPVKEQNLWEEMQNEMWKSQMIQYCIKNLGREYPISISDKIILRSISGKSEKLFKGYLQGYFYVKNILRKMRRR